jgi:hypothetical protein
MTVRHTRKHTHCSTFCKDLEYARNDCLVRLEEAELGSTDVSGLIREAEMLDNLEQSINAYIAERVQNIALLRSAKAQLDEAGPEVWTPH